MSDVERKGHIQLRVANALWPQEDYALLEEFLALTKQYYFKGNWASQFDQSLTSDGPFWVESGERVRVPMMSKTYEYRRSVDP